MHCAWYQNDTNNVDFTLPRLGLASSLVCLASASSSLPPPCLASVKNIAALPRLCLDLSASISASTKLPRAHPWIWQSYWGNTKLQSFSHSVRNSHAPYNKRAWYQGAKNSLWPSTCAHSVWERVTKFCMIRREIVTGSTTSPALKRTAVTRMLTRGLLAVANLVLAIQSVCPSNACIVSKWMYISSHFLTT